MRSSQLVSIASLSVTILAHPIADSRQKRSPQPYSVVNVDGSGSGATVVDSSPTTVLQTITASAPSTPEETDTITQTKTTSLPAITTTLIQSGESSVVSTLVVTYTQPAPAASTQTIVSNSPTETETKTEKIYSTGWETRTTDPMSWPTESPEATVTIVSTLAVPTPSTTQYYDDGLWHTYYPITISEPFATPSPSATSSALPSAVPSPSAAIVSVEGAWSATTSTSSPIAMTSSSVYLNSTSTVVSIPATTSFSSISSNAWWGVPSISTPAGYPVASAAPAA